MRPATLSTVILRKVLLGTLLIGLAILSTPALSHLPDIANGQMPTLAPLVREVTPSVVNISVHGRVKEENPLYRDPVFREFVDVPNISASGMQMQHTGCIGRSAGRVESERGYSPMQNCNRARRPVCDKDFPYRALGKRPPSCD